MDITIRPIARMRSDFPSKFGIPRQSGLVQELKSTIVFEPEFRNADTLRGLDGYSHLWLIWQFSEAVRNDWSPTVRPPRLGGNVRMGVFATRSPFRPNNLGLSCVRLIGVEQTATEGTVVHVAGADLMDGTPIFDIKPYVPYSDCHPDALGGFTTTAGEFLLKVDFPKVLLSRIPANKQDAAIGVLSHDPRPSYQRDPNRVYGLPFAGYDIHFTVQEDQLQVCDVIPLPNKGASHEK
jgi:tRNA-Thr(GGU) m(6)t(6)A37 methyltransferase TsaA